MRWLTIILFFWIIPTFAVVVHTLYQAQVSVTSSSSYARNKAFGRALQQVLIKVSGNPGVVTLPAIQDKLSQAGSLVQSYGYSDHVLEVKFAPQTIQQILTTAGQALWGNNRPLILVWLVTQDESGAKVIVGDSNNILVTGLQNNAARRGLPILLPVKDLLDLSSITINDIESVNVPVIQAASARYNTAAILLGDLLQVNGKWQGKWTLLLNGDSMHWTLTGKNKSQVISAIMDDVADSLAMQYAVIGDSSLSKQLTLLVTGVHNLDEYSQVIGYLQNLHVVTKVELADVTPEGIKQIGRAHV